MFHRILMKLVGWTTYKAFRFFLYLGSQEVRPWRYPPNQPVRCLMSAFYRSEVIFTAYYALGNSPWLVPLYSTLLLTSTVLVSLLIMTYFFLLLLLLWSWTDAASHLNLLRLTLLRCSCVTAAKGNQAKPKTFPLCVCTSPVRGQRASVFPRALSVWRTLGASTHALCIMDGGRGSWMFKKPVEQTCRPEINVFFIAELFNALKEGFVRLCVA